MSHPQRSGNWNTWGGVTLQASPPRMWPGAPASGTTQAKAMIHAVPEAGAPSKPRQWNEGWGSRGWPEVTR